MSVLRRLSAPTGFLSLRTLAVAMLTLLAVAAFVFFFSELLPGDTAERVLGRESTSEQRALFRTRMGLDDPAPVRFASWLLGLLRGDLGTSVATGSPVSTVVGGALARTLLLAGVAFLIYIPLTLVAASVSALYRDRTPDRVTSYVTLGLLSLPEFVVGTLLILLFAVMWPILPALSLAPPGAGWSQQVQVLVLPSVTLSIVMAVYSIRMLRESLIEVLESEHVSQAYLRGLPRRRVLLRHALPSALGPVMNVTALNFTYLIGGVVVVELVFSYPGVGRVLVNAIHDRDLPVVQAIVLVASATYISANLLADAVAKLGNPRLRSMGS